MDTTSLLSMLRPEPFPSTSVPVIVPDLGTSGTPLTISSWFVDPDTDVLAGDALLEVLLPGITCDIAAPVSGRLDRIEKNVDSSVQAGDVLAWIIPALADADES